MGWADGPNRQCLGQREGKNPILNLKGHSKISKIERKIYYYFFKSAVK